MAYRGYQGFRLTPLGALIGLNLLLFIVTRIAPGLILLLGLRPASFLLMPWTIVTSMFVHGGFSHIIANMLALYFFGGYLSRLVGTNRFLVVYFAGGILGSILFLLLASPFSMVVGASGGVFALGGALTVLMPRLRVFIFPIPVPIPLWVAVIGGFLILSFVPGIAWQAHLGGLIVGLMAGSLFKKGQRYRY